MMKRTIPLVLAAVMLFSVAPAALADHCEKCKISMTFECITAITGGRPICISDGFSCTTSGALCTHNPSAATSLAAEYTVASVERLDEPATKADDKLVAALEAPQPTRSATR
jgi:hypothetical protein